jgi:hypothetical protein
VKKIWKFKLKEDRHIVLNFDTPDVFFTEEKNGKKVIVGYIIDNVLTVLNGYEWDGCTPKIRIFGKILGVPDFEGTYEASLFHDFLIEYFNYHSISRKQIDSVFTCVMLKCKFKYERVYSLGVNLFRKLGNKFGWFKKPV